MLTKFLNVVYNFNLTKSPVTSFFLFALPSSFSLSLSVVLLGPFSFHSLLLHETTRNNTVQEKTHFVQPQNLEVRIDCENISISVKSSSLKWIYSELRTLKFKARKLQGNGGGGGHFTIHKSRKISSLPQPSTPPHPKFLKGATKCAIVHPIPQSVLIRLLSLKTSIS